MRNNLAVSDDIRAALGNGTVGKLQAGLVPVDCLTCGEEITDADGLNLAIDDLNVALCASLHHQECRPSAWVRHSPAEAENFNLNLTWRACVLGWEAAGIPVLLVNPSCEAAILTRTGTGHRSWRIATLDKYADAGFTAAARQASSFGTVQGLNLQLDPNRLTVTSASGPLKGTSWNAALSEAGYSQAHARGHVLAGVTVALDPKLDSVTEGRLNELTRHEEVLYARVPIERPAPKADMDRLPVLIELIRRGTGSVPSRDQLSVALMLYEQGTTLGALPHPTGRDLEMVVLLITGMYAATEGPVHVMTQGDHLSQQLTDACRKVFGPKVFPVSRVGEPSFTSERRISIGTYKEIAAARARFDSDPRTSAEVLPLAFAIDPVPGSDRGVVLRRYSRLIELGEQPPPRSRLAADSPATYEPDLASSPTNLGTPLEKAVDACKKHVDACRRLAATSPANTAYEAELAHSLACWAWVLNEAQQDLPGALRATGEAVEIYRKFVRALPEEFLPPLHDALGLQANLLLSLGRPREAADIQTWLAANALVPGSRKRRRFPR
ncbi:hypothetical protein [Streptomyces sp. NPDC052107]|uniref:hypothetical protein n=1 Tax=Streptomyces sp. NPDC052107 TaxID=3155632 RepID=UPI0034469D8E